MMTFNYRVMRCLTYARGGWKASDIGVILDMPALVFVCGTRQIKGVENLFELEVSGFLCNLRLLTSTRGNFVFEFYSLLRSNISLGDEGNEMVEHLWRRGGTFSWRHRMKGRK